MTEALSELSSIVASSRDARLFNCFWQAETALCYAQRGNIGGTVRFLTRAQLLAERHRGSFNDSRAVLALARLRRECATALTVKVRG